MAIADAPKPGQFVGPLDQWKAAAMARGISDADQERDQARVFRKIRDALQVKGVIRIHGEYAWLPDQWDQ